MFLMVSRGSLAMNMQHTYFYTCLQKVSKTEMNSTSLLETEWFSCDEAEFCLVSDCFVFSSNTVETEMI